MARGVMGQQQQQHQISNTSGATAEHTHAQPTQQLNLWTLALPHNLQAGFYRDRSVQRIYVLFDAATIIQALVVNRRFLKGHKPNADSQELLQHRYLLWHEELGALIFLVLAVLQALFIVARPRLYMRHRHSISLINRTMRLLLVLVSATVLTPALALKQGLGYFTQRDVSSTQATARMLMASPMIYLFHSNFIVSHMQAVFIQLLTCAATIVLDLRRLCSERTYNPAAASSAVPACQALSWLATAGGQLLDMPVLTATTTAAAALPTGGLEAGAFGVCGSPLAATLLMKVWANVVLLVLLPCTMVYSIERSLKTNYLSSLRPAAESTRAALAAASQQQQQQQQQQQPPPPLPQQLDGVGGRDGEQHAPREQELQREQEQLLAGIAPLSLRDMLMPGPNSVGPSWWTFAVHVAAALFCLVALWFVCEGVLSVVLHGQRQLVCDADGWLNLV